MTFEQWFEQEFGEHPDSDRGEEGANISTIARMAWEAAWEDGRRTGVSAQVGWQDYLDRYDD